MLKALLMFIPTEAYLTLMVVAGIMMMIGMRKIASSIILSVLAMAIFGPLIETLIDSLPLWALILVMIAAAFSLIRLVMGRRIFEHVASRFVYDLIRAPFRIIRWLLGAIIPRRR